jgi:hypothetical protein
VSPGFNRWNSVRVNSGEYVSRFKGVSKNTQKGLPWRARGFQGVYVGIFGTEREAAIASATSYIRAYGVWAETSDLLFTEDQSSPGALLSLEELSEIKRSIATVDITPKPSPKCAEEGVFLRHGKYYEVKFRGKWLKQFKDYDDAVAFRRQFVAAVQDGEWQAHMSITPTRDADGDVAIALSDGKHGVGITSKVDAQYWHQLTYKTRWFLDAPRYARSSKVLLHKAVMLLVDPDYVSGRNASIDHINPAAKLDNRAANLRVVTHQEQMRNKVKRPGGTSPHIGVCRRGHQWLGQFGYTTSDGHQTYRVTGNTEGEVVIALNAKRLEMHGTKAVLDNLRSLN